MKCPKCGYNSFEIHDTCKKCANDLTGYKDIHGLKSIVLPHETRTTMAEKLMGEKVPDDQAAVAEAQIDMFSFDTTESETAVDPGSFLKDDPFDFGVEPAATSPGGYDFNFGKEQMSAQAKAEEDAFANLLESSSLNKGGASSASQPAEAKTQVASELNDFNWDDITDSAPGETVKSAEDEFNSLFGDTDDTAKK